MRLITVTIAVALGCAPVAAKDTKTSERLDDSASLFSEIMSTPDKSIPQDLLNKSYCIVLVPGLKKGAFVVGGKYGHGFVLCRNKSGEGWGPPASIRVEGGSIGFQIGVSSTDVVLLIMNDRGMKRLESSKFTIGGEATAAAGPVGRDAQAQTDALLRAEILSWSRSKGLFAGVSLDGATLRTDLDENRVMYGQRWDTKQVLDSAPKPPASAARLISELNKYSPKKSS